MSKPKKLKRNKNFEVKILEYCGDRQFWELRKTDDGYQWNGVCFYHTDEMKEAIKALKKAVKEAKAK